MHKEITTIDKLKDFMSKEAETYGRTESDITSVNSRGIEKQWQENVAEDTFPAHIFALIYINEPMERPDGSMTNGCFSIFAFWFNKEGQRIEKPKNV